MPPSAFEVAMQMIASVSSGYLDVKNGVPVMTKDGMKRTVNEQFPHFEKTHLTLTPPDYPREPEEKQGAIKKT
ncbi:UNVERIFIED_CONTAM: hypothetical protein K2H54_022794 [Gekko kuhli]